MTDPLVLIAILTVSFLSGFLSGSIGFASGVVPTALLALVLPPAVAVPLLAFIVFLGAAIALVFYWGQWERRHILIIFPPLLVGTWLGTVFLATASASLVHHVVGGFVILVAIQELVSRFTGRDAGPAWHRQALGSLTGGLLIGLLSGITSAVAHAGGVVISAYLLSVGLRKEVFTGTILALLVLADTAKLVTFLQAGLLTTAMIEPIAWSVPFLVIGVYIGRHVYQRIPARQFRQVIAGTLLGLGVLLLSL